MSESGFTLMELLVVVAIVGILASIALPQFRVFKTRAFDARANSDLRNAVTAQEATRADSGLYNMCSDAGCNTPALTGFRLSEGVSISCAQILGGIHFQCSAVHSQGSNTFYYNSQTAAFWSMP